MLPSITGEAAEIFADVRGLIADRKEWEASLRTRARSMPSLIASHGIVSALAFLMSKSNDKMFRELLGGGVKNNYGREEAGYTLYLYVLYRFLGGRHGFLGECGDMECLLGELVRLDSDVAAAAAAGSLALEFAVEFKKLADALLEGE